ncbi:MAG: sigma-54-dependent Fis family transcriptional regulator [bacterium]
MQDKKEPSKETVNDISDIVLSKEKLKALLLVSQRIHQISNIEVLLNEIMNLAITNIGAERGLIILADESGEIYHTLVSESLDEGEITFSRSIVQETLKCDEVLLSFDVQHDQRFKDSKSVKEFNILSFVCVPLSASNYDYPLGTLYVDQRMYKRTFTNDDITFLKAFANLAAIAVSNANLIEKLRIENVELREEVGKKYDFPGIIGEGKAMQDVFGTVKQIMNDDCTVLITGESGSGKEVIAKAIHYNSYRTERPFIAINCGAMPDTLLEAELFGSVRGAFTGAIDKQGLFQAATGGTLFLDEIHHTSEAMQIKLLRVLQEKEIRKVGSTRSIKVNVRLICASNEDLQVEINKGKFRRDFYYRINVVTIEIPPLRKRREDIAILADHFLKRFCKAKKKRCKGFSRQGLVALMRYDWRENNVRELENEVERVVIFVKDKEEVQLHDLSPKIWSGKNMMSASSSELFIEAGGIPMSFKQFEKRYIEFVLSHVDGNRTQAAKIMRIPRSTLLGKIRRLGIK